MATIAEIREKYPQYSDMPDAALADALHSKFYSDLPKNDFYTKIGLSTAASTGYGSVVPQVTPQGQLIRQPDAIPSARPSMQDVLGGIVETPLALGTGMIAAPVAALAGVGRSVTGGQYGTQEGVRQGQELAGRVQQALTYQPQTRGGQASMQTIGEVTEPLQAIPFSQGATAAALAPAAVRQAGNIARTEAGVLKQAIGEIPSVKASKETKIADSYARGPQIDAAKLAQKYEIALDPAVSNPTAANRVRSALVGEGELDFKLSSANEPKWTAIAKKDLGLGKETQLTSPKVFDDIRARDDISGPYKVVAEIPSIRVPANAFQKLDDLQVTPLFGDTGQAATTNAYLSNLKTQLAEGGNGAKLLKSIQQMRQEAQNVYRADKAGTPIDPSARAAADAKMNAARVLEEMIDDNITNIGARDAFIKARTKMAQTYDWERSTDFGTGKIDPQVLAKFASEGKPLSGTAAELAQIAANYPEVSRIGASAKTALPRLTRAGIGGMTGFLAGSAMGGPVAGIVAGAALSDIARRVAAKNMLSPAYQAKRAVPRDYRPEAPPVNALRPVEPGQSNIVPFDPRNALIEPEIRPNFVFGRGEVPADVRPVSPSAGPRQIGMDSPADVTARLRAEDARRTRMAQMAEAEGLAAEGRGRAPTSGEVLFDLDPITGQLRPASQGIRGATPETFQDYTATLRSATNKISSGQKFALDASEKVAFDKTRVDLAEVAPGFKALNDRAIADKMMDRNWVEDTLKAARQKDAAFAEIQSRARSPELMGARAESAKNAEMLRQATEARDRVKSSIDLLEEQLRQMRPDTSRKQQGPKTRAAKRNALRGDDDEILNKLVP
jgi:hypothetical protein